MKDPQEHQIFRIAAGLLGIAMNDQTAETILEIMKGMKEHGDKFSVHHASDIEYNMEQKYKRKSVKAQRTIDGKLDDILEAVKRKRRV